MGDFFQGSTTNIQGSQIATHTITGENIALETIGAVNIFSNAVIARTIALPGWTGFQSQEKVETPAGFTGAEAALINNGEVRLRGVWKTTAAIPAKTEFIKLTAAQKPSVERKGQLALLTGALEKLTITPFAVTTTGILPENELPISSFIYWNGGWYNA